MKNGRNIETDLRPPTREDHHDAHLRRAAPHGLRRLTKPNWSSSGCSGAGLDDAGLRNRSEGAAPIATCGRNAKGKEMGMEASIERSCA